MITTDQQQLTAGTSQSEILTCLHVGCGPANPAKLHKAFRGPQWREVRLDVNPDVRPDVVASITKMEMVTTGSVDAVWSSHNLEHLYPHEVPLALAEFHRVLKLGGVALITLPDLQRAADLIASDKLDEIVYQSPAGPVTPLDMLFGFRPAVARGDTFMAHHTGFTAKTLGQALVRAGFVGVRVRRDGFDLWATARKPLSDVPTNG